MVSHARDARHFGYVMHAHDVRAAEDGGGDCGRGAEQALFGGQRRLAKFGERFPKKRFARGADDDGAAEAREFREPGENFKILFVGLAETDSGIDKEL